MSLQEKEIKDSLNQEYKEKVDNILSNLLHGESIELDSSLNSDV